MAYHKVVSMRGCEMSPWERDPLSSKVLIGVCCLSMLAIRPSGAEDPVAQSPSRLVLRVSPERLVLDRPGEAGVQISPSGPILSEGADPRLHLRGIARPPGWAGCAHGVPVYAALVGTRRMAQEG
jgi:hypothetical protein